MATNAECAQLQYHHIGIGFSDGSFTIYRMHLVDQIIDELYTHPPSIQGPTTAIAACWPYLLTVGQCRVLSLYHFKANNQDPPHPSREYVPTLISSLRSESLRDPLSLSLRRAKQSLFGTIAFSVPTMNSGWRACVQELRFSEDGVLQHSRLVHAPWNNSYDFTGLSNQQRPSQGRTIRAPPVSQPTSISYSHPYLLMSHADNTLTVHLVTTTPGSLKVSHATRLWGHTSAVFGAHVGSRGRAVSVSKGVQPEIRIWQLEGATGLTNPCQVADAEQDSVQLVPEKRSGMPDRLVGLSHALINRGNGLGLALQDQVHELVTRGWVGFDEENIVLFKEEHSRRRQALAVYDFS